MKIGKILDSLNFGSADGPRVRGGQSAVHGICSPEALQRSFSCKNCVADDPPKDCGRSAGHRCNWLASDTPTVCSLSKARIVRHWTADSPLLDSFTGFFEYAGGRSAQGPRTVRPCAELWGRPVLTYNGLSLSPSPPNRTHITKSSLPFSLKHSQACGGDFMVKDFWRGS